MSVSLTLPLSDQAARECAATDLSTTYLMEAAAGTGKTTLLVQRVMTIIRGTLTPLSQIVAITFTEKAAGELKVKIRRELENAAGDPDEEIAARCRRALLDLDGMPVGTIHGFCRDLIAQRPVEARVDPQFLVAEEETARNLAEEAWERWLTTELARDNPAVQPLLERGIPLVSRRSEPSLRTPFDFLIQYREDLTRVHGDALDEATVLRRTSEWCRQLRRDLQVLEACVDHTDLCATELQRIESWSRSCPPASLDEIADWLENAPKPKHKGGRQGAWRSAPELTTALALRKEFSDRVRTVRSLLFSHWTASVITWMKGAVELYQAIKRERGLVDFADLLILARDLLRHHPDVRESLKTRYAYVLVDEFQDTDPLQAEIVFYLCEKTGRCAGDWQEVELDAGKLFIVGDPKQSIYRFRRADLDLYGRTTELIEARRSLRDGERLTINVNFRSAPELLNEINAIFAPWMTGPTAGRYEPEYVPLAPFRASHGAFARACFITPPVARNGQWYSPEATAAEAAAVSEYVLRLTGTSTDKATAPSYPDPPPGMFAFRDIAILYFTATHLHQLESALRTRGIPYQVSRGKSFAQRSEVQALRSVLAALDNPYDEVNVVGALRSPFFSCSDPDLLSHHRTSGNFVYLNEPDAASPLRESFATLRALHHLRNRATASQVVSTLYERTCGLHVFALKPQGESRVANLLKVLDLARALDAGAESSFHELVNVLDRMEDLAQQDDSPASEPGDDVVQLMTVHKAKGLEFPVVILYHLAYDPERRKNDTLLRRPDHIMEWKSGGWETAGYQAALAEEQDRAQHEARRLLYVAMTRAREMLILPAYWKTKGKGDAGNTYHRILEARFPDNGNGIPRVEGTAFTLFPTDHVNLDSELREGITLDLEAMPDAGIVSEARQRRARWELELQSAASSLLHRERFLTPSEHAWPPPQPEFEAEFRRDGRPLGELVHRVLQQVTLPGGEDLELLAERHGEALNLDSETIHTATVLARRALLSPLLRRALASDRFFRELRFTALVDGKVCEGALDLLFIEHGRPVIVDYKTDDVDTEQAPERALIYQAQIAAYTRAVETILGGPTPSAVLYFLRPDIIVELPLTKPA